MALPVPVHPGLIAQIVINSKFVTPEFWLSVWEQKGFLFHNCSFMENIRSYLLSIEKNEGGRFGRWHLDRHSMVN
jgi:hypothetical protein